MKISPKQKIVLMHAVYSAGATAIAGGIGWFSAHGVDLVGKRYEFYIAAALIPALEYARKWFLSQEKLPESAREVILPPAVIPPTPEAPAEPAPGDATPAA